MYSVRYVYVVSQWTVESRVRSGDSDDEDDAGAENEVKPAKFGVDIYDPLKSFEHVRSVELYELVKTQENQKKPAKKAILNAQCLDLCSFTTTGDKLIVVFPQNLDFGEKNLKQRVFDLKSGKLIDSQELCEKFTYSKVCFDFKNNVT